MMKKDVGEHKSVEEENLEKGEIATVKESDQSPVSDHLPNMEC